jgi:hypothetical protein
MEPIRVFPNTGHQYFTVPLRKLLPKRDEASLQTFALANRDVWKRWDDYTRWIRYQYAIERDAATEEDVAVIKLAIETNLGLPSRGLLFDVDDKLYDQRPEEDMGVPSAYASTDEAQIEADFGTDRLMPLTYLPNKEGKDIDINLEVHWTRSDGRDPIDVDLVCDLGNSRTIALLLEAPGQQNSGTNFGRRVRIVRFVPRATPFDYGTAAGMGSVLDDSCAIIDSWLLLHRPLFAQNDPPFSDEKICEAWKGFFSAEHNRQMYMRKKYLPHAFVELSPALIGGGASPEGAAKILANVTLNHDARFFLSSPKRYVWDERQLGFEGGTIWKQIPNPTDKQPPNFFDDLGGLVRYFMDPGGVDWNIDSPPSEDDFRGMPFPNSRPTYPRRDAVCWFALSILEAAYRQINSLEYRRSTGRESLPRRLRHVRVTYPSGWTTEERNRYLAQWQRAIDLFTLTRLEDHRPISIVPGIAGGQRPLLVEENLDEAVASQLPILYSDFKALANDGQNWFQLFGANGKAVVMNIDIGGGTTDLSIIEYQLKQGEKAPVAGIERNSTLLPHLRLRHGTRIAGDLLVKKIIERVIVPAWVRAAGDVFAVNEEAGEWVTRLMKNPAHNEFSNVDPRASQKLARAIRLVFIPLANALLGRMAQQGATNAAWGPVTVADYADPTIAKDLNELVNNTIRRKTRLGGSWRGTVFPFDNVALKCDRAEVEACIDDVFRNMFDSLASLVGQFNCQVVIVSGKPSELPRVRELIVEAFPLLPQRIIQVKNFPAGSWYPFSSFDGGRILDAKTCTVVGAALYQDICNGVLEGFSIADERELSLSRQFYWGLLNRTGMPDDFYDKKNLLFSPRDYPPGNDRSDRLNVEKTFVLPLNCRIGRQIARMTDIRPDPVYELAWTPRFQVANREAYASVKLRWISERGGGERIELVEVKSLPAPSNDPETARRFPAIDPTEVSLRLNTMLEDSYWLDDPKLEVATFG